jgi:phospholipid transport system substrate-binding protein
MMNLRILFFLLFSFLSFNGYADSADELVKSVSEKLISTVKNDKSLQGNRGRIAMLVDQEVSPYVNFSNICSKSLGKGFDVLTLTERDEYSHLCKNLIINTYSYGLAEFRNISVKVKPATPAGNGQEMVRSIISQDGDDDINVDYYMEKSASGWQVEDVHIDGVSMISNLYNQFSSILNSSGIQVLLNQIRTKLAHK